LKRITVIV